MTENTPKWVAGLNNGETLTEGKGICEGDDKASAWAKLKGHLSDNDLRMTSFSIHVGDKHFNLPGNNSRFGGEIPIDYNCLRKYAGDALGTGTNVEEYICAEAIYDGYRLQVWVDIHDTNKSWINIIK